MYFRSGADGAEQVLHFLKQVENLSLSPKAIDGVGVFATHAKGPNRMKSVLEEMTQFDPLSQPAARVAMERMFGNLSTLDQRIGQIGLRTGNFETMKRIEGLFANFVARGAGTSRHFRSTGGFNHQLEAMLKYDAATLAKLKAFDSSLAGYAGRVDALLEETVRNAHTGTDILADVVKEFKRVKPGEKLTKGQLAQFRAQLNEIVKQAGGARRPDFDELGRKLHIHYVIRGGGPEIRDQLLNEAKKVLRGRLKPFVNQIKVGFEGAWPYSLI